MLWIEAQPFATEDDLRTALQNAIRLEHATIPPYLTAMHTLKTSPATTFAVGVFSKIVRQEMLHMTLVCNILNAIGGHPDIANENFVPKYPDVLPMGVAGDLVVRIRRYSKALVENTFMKIEEPEHPLDISTLPAAAAAAEPITIGQFYQGIRASLADHVDLFAHPNPHSQVTGLLSGNVAVTNLQEAQNAIDLIIEQGEGTPDTPLNEQQKPAHYYAFQQLSKGMQLVADANGTNFHADKPITIDETVDVIAMIDDPSTVIYDAADARAEQLAVQVDTIYSDMLRTLRDAFNGDPDRAQDAVALMMSFDPEQPGLAEALDALLTVELTAGSLAGQFAGPRYRYIPKVVVP
jgi:hypothetical protein